MRQILIWTMMLCVPILGFAQYRDQPGETKNIDEYLRSSARTLGFPTNVGSLLDPSRMHWSHSYSMAYATSSNGSVMQGVFTTDLVYELSRPLTLMFRLGYMHEPYNSYLPEGMSNQGQVFGGAGLTYRPTRNMVFHLEFQQLPASSITYRSPYSSYYHPWGYSR
jgi:uncharacterized membrane protein